MSSTIQGFQAVPYQHRRIGFTPVSCILFLFALIIFTACHQKSDSPPELIRVPYTSHDQGERDFFLYLPQGYRNHPDSLWPVILFLHGNGERGNGKDELRWVLKEGLPYEVWIQKRNLPFVIIMPQLPMYGMDTVQWIHDRDTAVIPKRLASGVPDRPEEFSTPDTMGPVSGIQQFPPTIPRLGWEKSAEEVMQNVKSVIQDYHVDTNRIYLTGLSYGGYGTWYLASHYADTWAAIAPVAGWGHPDLMLPIAEHQIPVWAFGGGRDQSVNLGYFYAELNRLEKLGAKEVRFTIEEDMGHDAWRRVYGGDDLYTWMLSKSRKRQ
jgi:predicted peptidase